ncbi:hypothetical protein Zmor_023817 [Zophobas morio]|uniref:Zinc finger PHD-type domain-containing protein n=1 Tax=Zophobas morio TaxID=2755281 RepID=A0AA38M8B8_9CUCU|nr:hypothetical protein Zmor_023817 [Zophobas morio]
MDKCPGCSASVASDISLLCDGCDRSMHFSCVALPPDAAVTCDRARRISSHLKILCAECDNNFKLFKSHLGSTEGLFATKCRELIKEECADFIAEFKMLRSEVNVLKDSNIDLVKLLTSNANNCCFSEKNPTSEKSAVISYASKVNTDKKIVVKPKNTAQSVSQTRSDLLKNVNMIDEKIAVTKVKSVSSGGLLISCQDEAGGKKFKELASVNLSKDYNIKEVEPLRPRIRIVGISSDISENVLLSYMEKQNPDLVKESSFCKLIRFWPTRSNANIFQADIEVDNLTYDLLLKSGHILIGLNPCSVYDSVSVPRCFNCNGFFHNSKQCKKDLSCPLCAGKHKVKDCTLGRNKSDVAGKQRCINCMSMRNPPENLNVNHAAWEYSLCESYKVALQHLKNNLFCDSFINKNLFL